MAFTVGSLGDVSVVGAPIVVNSSALLAYVQAGSGTISALENDIVGGYLISGLGNILGAILTGVTPTPDPLRFIPAPNLASYPVQSVVPLSITTPGLTVLQPGIYQGGVSITVNGNVQMMPGVHIMDGGGFKVAGNSLLLADGVMIYNTGTPTGPIQIGGTGKIQMSPPTSGTYQGISIFQDRASNQALSITGNGNTQITGTVYGQSAAVHLASAGTTSANVLGGGYVSNTMSITAGSSFSINSGHTRPKNPEVRLVE
jgi:hypothetical protein